VKLIKLLRLKWYGHITKMNSESMKKKKERKKERKKKKKMTTIME
jgi:hypothetical protein